MSHHASTLIANRVGRGLVRLVVVQRQVSHGARHAVVQLPPSAAQHATRWHFNTHYGVHECSHRNRIISGIRAIAPRVRRRSGRQQKVNPDAVRGMRFKNRRARVYYASEGRRLRAPTHRQMSRTFSRAGIRSAEAGACRWAGGAGGLRAVRGVRGDCRPAPAARRRRLRSHARLMIDKILHLCFLRGAGARAARRRLVIFHSYYAAAP
ncbi:hypothetical protein EVAR_45982_1 [Eumeta japonica]|uniref:Uncharacterized protein n=1 Tax=Eumeta variegata TaxID=151549 RepID=A0A4C1XBU1_EUMVA|nr:hypothetical protein EVAR_45982_1 [Eumeta japonica]